LAPAGLADRKFWNTERVLIRRHRGLDARGIVARTDHRTRPPRVDHALTAHGRTLEPLLAEPGLWGALHLERAAAGSAAPDGA
jgi:DNA-binding HxlR family transcriptional regulator